MRVFNLSFCYKCLKNLEMYDSNRLHEIAGDEENSSSNSSASA